MNAPEILSTLEKFGKPQTAAIYKRYGSGDKVFGVLATIEKEIHSSPNWARYAMNGALISIGVFKPALRKKAIAAARRIGRVEVDYGETNCKTPDAGPYIEKASKRKLCP